MILFHPKNIATLYIIIYFVLSLSAVSSHADGMPPESAPSYTGLAMHGTPKYDSSATHLDYANPDAPKGGTLKIGATGTFDTLNPFSIKGSAAQGLSYVYDRLMARVYDEPFSLYPSVAEKAEVAEDRSSVTFTLNPAAKFSDGSPITADDVLFSFETLKEHGRPNMQRIYKLADKAEKQGERTVYFHFGPGYDRETIMIFAMMPVLSKKWWEGRNFEETLLEPPVSSGPYKISAIDSPRRIVYERVKDHWAQDLLPSKGHNNFDTIIYDFYRDDGVALEAFKKGDLNLRREFDKARWFNAYQDIDKSRIVTEEIPHHRPELVQGLILNMRRPPLDDIRVRQALFLALDSEWIGKNLYFNAGKRIRSFFPNSSLDGSGPLSESASALLAPYKDKLLPSVFEPALTDPDAQPLRQRLREANRLLTESGWIVENGKRIHKDTRKPLTFEVILTTPPDEKTILNYAKSLEKLGITLTSRLLDASNFQNRKTNYDYDIVLFYWQNSLSPGTEQMIYWSCEAAKQPARFNFSGICNPALDSLAKGIADAKTYEDLTAHAHAIDRILLSEVTVIPLFYTGLDYIAYDRSIRHPELIPLSGLVMETWWMEPQNNPSADKQKEIK
jgi:microcin C transport system substrate-binding protein